MKILSDLHHGQLYDSHNIVFSKRLGHELYRPMGWDWYDKQYYWNWGNNDTKEQYLGTSEVQSMIVNNKVKVLDIYYSTVHKAISFEHFLDSKFDVILASTPQQHEGFTKLIKEYGLKSKFVFQMGNMWFDYPKTKNIMNSTTVPIEAGVHTIQYYPEFELELFRREVTPSVPTVSCFLHYNSDHYRDLFFEVEKCLPDWKFNEYGAGNRNGPIFDVPEKMSEAMLNSDFVWHVKRSGDGYGFILHEAMASGRPVIVSRERYKGMTAERMFLDDKTCLNIDNKSPQQIADKLVIMYKNIQFHRDFCKQQFNSIVNFTFESEKVKWFLENLV